MSDFIYSNSNKRYHTLAYHNCVCKCKSQKAVIDLGLTCPNIDGAKSFGGCRFCDGGSGYFTPASTLSVSEQIACERERIQRKKPDAKIIAYFQAHTNTYCSAEFIDEYFSEALSCKDVCGVSVATRPDCLDAEKIELLSKYRDSLTVELGLQTVHDKTAEKFNRCYNYSDFLSSYIQLKEKGIRVCLHIIDGLMGETKEMMIETARKIGRLHPDALKIHLLHINRGTKMAEDYERGLYTPLSMEEYVDIVVSQLEILPQETVIERITGDADKNKLLAPLWSRDKIRVLGTIDKEMKKRETYQGRLFVAE